MEVTILSVVTNDDGNIRQSLLAYSDKNKAAEDLHKYYIDEKCVADANGLQIDCDDVNIIYEEQENDIYRCDSFFLANEKYHWSCVGNLSTLVVL